MIRVLILCTGNSARSQIAEGLFRQLAGDGFDIHSAGTYPTGSIHHLAIETMKEHQIDIRNQSSKSLSLFEGKPFDYVITVCDDARQQCPVFPGAHQLHWSTPDPSFAPGGESDRKEAFRKTIDRLESQITTLLKEIKKTIPRK